MSEFLIIILIIIVVAIPAGLLDAKRKERLQKEEEDKSLQAEYQRLIKQLHAADEDYHRLRGEWIAFHERFEDLGDPTYTVGYSGYEGKYPWTYPAINVPYEGIAEQETPELRRNAAQNALNQLLFEYDIPKPWECATFYKDARYAIIAGHELNPEDLRFIKSNTDKILERIVVTITTTNIEQPTFSMYFSLDDRSTVDDLKAAFNAFKELKQPRRK